MKFLLSAIVLSTSIFAMAQQGPQIEPGPSQKIDDKGALTALLSIPAAKFAALKVGTNEMSVSTQLLSPGVTSYTFAAQSCTNGGFAGHQCLGGKMINVRRIEKRQGEMVSITYTASEVSNIK